MTSCPHRAKFPIHPALGALLLWGFAGPVSAQNAVLALSPDVTLEIGVGSVLASDHDVASVASPVIGALENLGSIPEAADVTGFADSGSRRLYFTVDTTVVLAGNVTVRPADVAYWDGRAYGLGFDSRLAGIPDGVAVDALALPLSGGQFLLSFDTHVTLPGSLTVADEDVVRFGSGTFSLALDGSAVGIPPELDIDGLTDVGGGSFLVTFDTGGTIDGRTFRDEDVLQVQADGTWSLEYIIGNFGKTWEAANLDAFDLVPEPDAGAMLAAGATAVAALGRRRQERPDQRAGREDRFDV